MTVSKDKKHPVIDETLQLAAECIMALEEKKAVDTVLIDLKEVNSYFNYFIIATGSSHTHNKAIIKELKKLFETRGMRLLNRPDPDSGWIVMDYNEIVIHVFSKEMRDYYQLEKLWSDAPVVDVKSFMA